MGQGGQFRLVNQTQHDWVKTHEHSYQMNAWKLPDRVAAGSETQVYVEWDEGIFNNSGDDGADTTYQMEGTSESFALGARGRPGFHLFSNVAGQQSDLGWAHDGTTVFVMESPKPINTASWMHDNLGLLGALPLREIAITGSHDAGMSTNSSGGTAFAGPSNTITQTLPIGGQLAHGARYFDIRPVISGGHFTTGHYGNVDVVGWQGENGQSIASIISDVNAFTDTHAELVILNLSHDLNTDVGRDYRGFNAQEWSRLFDQMSQGLRHLTDFGDEVLTEIPLGAFIGKGAAVVVLVHGAPSDVALPRGFYAAGQMPIYDSYADTDDLNKMMSDQMAKMEEQTNAGNYFLLSWTLTQQGAGAVFGPSILDLAAKANAALLPTLVPVRYAGFPNIIYIDKYDSDIAVKAAMAVNRQRHG